MDAPARGARTAEAVRLLIEDFEACTAQVAELRARLRRHELDRKRLAAAVEPALASLPEEDARQLDRGALLNTPWRGYHFFLGL